MRDLLVGFIVRVAVSLPGDRRVESTARGSPPGAGSTRGLKLGITLRVGAPFYFLVIALEIRAEFENSVFIVRAFYCPRDREALLPGHIGRRTIDDASAFRPGDNPSGGIGSANCVPPADGGEAGTGVLTAASDDLLCMWRVFKAD
jgi:hypothetical protein